MTSLKQSSNKNLRSKGFKVRNVLQLCLLLAICIWLLHQVRHCYDNKKLYKERTVRISEEQSKDESIKFGRKDLHFQVQQTTSEMDRHGNEGEFKMEFDEVEENKLEEGEDEGRGGGDDEIDGRDQEKSEEEESEVEDLIDEEDREREDDIEEQESDEMGSQFEDERNSKAGRELDNGEDAARR